MENMLSKVPKEKKEKIVKKFGYKRYGNILTQNRPDDGTDIWLLPHENINEILEDHVDVNEHMLDEIFETCVINLIIDKLV